MEWNRYPEKTPKIPGRYFVTYYYLCEDELDFDNYGKALICTSTARVTVNRDGDIIWEEDINDERIFPVAWMDIPEPYTE